MNLGLLKYKQGEGKVCLKEDRLPDGVILCDILQDWIYELQEMLSLIHISEPTRPY